MQACYPLLSRRPQLSLPNMYPCKPAATSVEVSVILPSYNEGSQLKSTLDRLAIALGGLEASIEIVVVDDGSTDDTPNFQWSALVDSISVRYVRHDIRRGKGRAVLTGLLLARGRCVLYTDADLPIDLCHVEQAIHLIRSGSVDVVVGNRFHPESKISGDAGPARRIASKVIRYWSRLLAVRKVGDPQCCLKAMRAEVASVISQYLSLSGYAFDVELTYFARKLGFAIQEVPVSWTDRRAQIGVVRLIYITAIMLWDIGSIRWRHLAKQWGNA